MPRRSKPRGGVAETYRPSLADALRDMPRAMCARPDKVRYRSVKAAQTAAERLWLTDKRIVRPYPCGDHYHLTSRR